MIYRHRKGPLDARDTVKEHDQTMHFISSLPPKVKRLSRLLRGHWQIENWEHYVLDVTFAEDASQIRCGNSPDISAAFRRMAMLARTMRTVLGSGRLEDIGSTSRASSPDTEVIDYELHDYADCADCADFAWVRNSATRIIDSVRRAG